MKDILDSLSEKQKISALDISEIDIATELEAVQSLMPISQDDYQRLKASIQKDGQRDPVKGYYGNDGRFKLLSGVNRLKACIELKLDTVLIEPINIPDNERQDFAISENLDRRHFTGEQKRDVVKLLLKSNPELSDLAISKQAKVSDKTVKAVRTEMAGRSEIPNVDKRTDSKGRQQPARKPDKTPQNTISSPLEKSETTKPAYTLETFRAELVALKNKAKDLPPDDVKDIVKKLFP